MRLLALDIGTRRTGMAFWDGETDIVLPLDTLEHESVEELCAHTESIASSRHVQHLVLGLPLLPSGEEGEQARIVRAIGARLEKAGLHVSYADERYTTSRRRSAGDPDAQASCQILSLFLERNAQADT